MGNFINTIHAMYTIIMMCMVIKFWQYNHNIRHGGNAIIKILVKFKYSFQICLVCLICIQMQINSAAESTLNLLTYQTPMNNSHA